MTETAANAREILGIPQNERLNLYQGGLKLHWAPAAITAAAKAKVDCFKCDTGYSPDSYQLRRK